MFNSCLDWNCARTDWQTEWCHKAMQLVPIKNTHSNESHSTWSYLTLDAISTFRPIQCSSFAGGDIIPYIIIRFQIFTFSTRRQNKTGSSGYLRKFYFSTWSGKWSKGHKVVLVHCSPSFSLYWNELTSCCCQTLLVNTWVLSTVFHTCVSCVYMWLEMND